MRNVELKARLRDRSAAERACQDLGAAYQGDIRQVDTYFHVPEGRLKLREKDPGDDELIAYRRPDAAEPRASEYHIARAGPGLREVLGEALGIVAVVDKVRSLWLWRNVRIHLDRVESLGDFLEFEAVLDDTHNDSDGHEKLAILRETFGIDDADVIPVSYANLVLEQQRP